MNFCPICGSELLSGKTMRVICPNITCPFEDRRMGGSMIDQLLERRGSHVYGGAFVDQSYNERVWVKKGVENLIYND